MKIIGRESTPELKKAVEAAADMGNVESLDEDGNIEGFMLSVCLRSSAISVSEEVEPAAERANEREEVMFADAGA